MLGTPLTSWNKLSPRLKQDGIIETGRAFWRTPIAARGWLQAAAAALLLVGGAAFGRLSTALPLVQSREAGADRVSLASDTVATYRTVAEAQAVAARSQSEYQASMAFLAEYDTSGIATTSPAAIKTRLAALDRVSRIVGAALEDAPYDAVMNKMYLNAQGQRAASMRQLNSGSIRLTSY